MTQCSILSNTCSVCFAFRSLPSNHTTYRPVISSCGDGDMFWGLIRFSVVSLSLSLCVSLLLQCVLHRGPRWPCSTGCGPRRSARATYMWRGETFMPAPSNGVPSTSTCVSLIHTRKHAHQHTLVHVYSHFSHTHSILNQSYTLSHIHTNHTYIYCSLN